MTIPGIIENPRSHPHKNSAVVTGLGVMAPNGIDLTTFWKSLLEGESGIDTITAFDTEGFRSTIAGEVTDYDPAKHLPPGANPKRMSRTSQLGLCAALSALEDANIDLTHAHQNHPIDIVFGAGLGAAVDMIHHASVSVTKKGARAASPLLITAASPQATPVVIAENIGAPARIHTISTTCASGLDAIGHGASLVQSGKSDIVIAGGADSALSKVPFANMISAGLASTKNTAPKTASRPFDRDGDSGVLSEGAGVIIIESLTRAIAREQTPYFEITGYGSAIDRQDTDSGSGYHYSMVQALENAPLYPWEIDYICAWAPGHPVLDKAETDMIKKTFDSYAKDIPVSSIKGVTGNPFAAAGPLQVACCALAMRENKIPPTANCDNPRDGFNLNLVTKSPLIKKLNSALINAHGVGGGNSSLIVERIRP